MYMSCVVKQLQGNNIFGHISQTPPYALPMDYELTISEGAHKTANMT